MINSVSKRNILKLFTLLGLQLLPFNHLLSQTNYFVSASGDNTQSGSIDQPWQSIQYALEQSNNYDTLNVLSGVFQEKITIPHDHIYIRAIEASMPVLDATGITLPNAIITIANVSDIVIDGLELRNNVQNDAQGILVSGVSNNIIIKNCVIHDIHFSPDADAAVNETTNAQGIIAYGDNANISLHNLIIENNELYNCRLGYSEGIAVNGNVDGFQVRGNHVHDLSNIGIDAIGHEGTCAVQLNDQARNGIISNNLVHHCISAYATSGGIYVDGGKTIVIENNTCYHNGFGIEIGCENVGKSTDNISVRSNILYDNEVSGIALGGYDFPNGSGKVIYSTFRNNTCFQNDYSNSGNGEMYLSYSEGCAIENNIFYLTDQNTFAYTDMAQPGLNFNYNLFYSNDGAAMMNVEWNGTSYETFSEFQIGTQTNANSTFANPLFVNTEIDAPDFHLQSTSPAINSGNPNYSTAINEEDMDGQIRLNGTIDCGADEYYSFNNTVEKDVPTILIFPNPSLEEVKIIFDDHDIHLLELFSPSGQLILSRKSQFQENIRLTDQSAVYFLRIDQSFTTRICKR